MARFPEPGFARLFADTRKALNRYVRRLVRTPGAAEDIVQEVFARTYAQETQNGASSEPLRPYLFSAARNLASNSRRHDRVVEAYATYDLGPTPLHGTYESPEEAVLADERMRLLNAAVQSLPPQCRAAFTLRMFHDCSYKDIAARLGISPRTVEKHIAFGATAVHAALALQYKDAP